jgi:hypothetical protein
MRCRDVRKIVRRDSSSASSAANQTKGQVETCSPQVNSPSRLYPGISTERIMQAVEQQKRITQQLEDLQTQQKQRTALLSRACLKLLAGICVSVGILTVLLVALFLFQPDILRRLLALSSDAIAVLIAVSDGVRAFLSLIPSNNWLLAGAALAVVLLMGMWLRLMRYPREA